MKAFDKILSVLQWRYVLAVTLMIWVPMEMAFWTGVFDAVYELLFYFTLVTIYLFMTVGFYNALFEKKKRPVEYHRQGTMEEFNK